MKIQDWIPSLSPQTTARACHANLGHLRRRNICPSGRWPRRVLSRSVRPQSRGQRGLGHLTALAGQSADHSSPSHQESEGKRANGGHVVETTSAHLARKHKKTVPWSTDRSVFRVAHGRCAALLSRAVGLKNSTAAAAPYFWSRWDVDAAVSTDAGAAA